MTLQHEVQDDKKWITKFAGINIDSEIHIRINDE